ncbi:hypothetical protein [Paenibacillus sp. AGC30]
MHMFIVSVLSSLYFVVLFIVAIILGSLLVTAKNKLTGRYLNRYYIVSYKGNGVYELHFNPLFGFYYAKPSKYFELRRAAVSIFESKYPDTSLFAITSTLQGKYAKDGIEGITVEENAWKRFVGRQINYFVILRNLANYQKRPRTSEWQWMHLIRRVRETPPRKYWITKNPEGTIHHESI